ncbi:MAG: insulinase family protein [bacterium]
MKLAVFNGFFKKTALLLSIAAASQSLVYGQPSTTPERFQLLNGLRVLLLSRPGDQDVLLKLRIHSGAAFDLAGKAGSMALLGDLLFPDPATREYFTDEMQGRLNVVTDYDSITITMQGRANQFEKIAEILRTALVTTQLTPENVKKIRDGRIKIIKDTSISTTNLADRAIAARLFGDFPYGRPYNGTAESLERIERGDLMLARERFLNPNNATLVIIGGVERARANRALRQLLGVWRKSESIVPATFQQPAVPDARILIMNAPAGQSAEVRLAVRGFAGNDPDSQAASLLALVARKRWDILLPDLARNPVFVRHDAFALPGMFVMGATVDNLLATRTLSTAQEVIKSLASQPVTDTELEAVKADATAAFIKQLSAKDGTADAWLDVDTYSVKPGSDQLLEIAKISSSDLKRAANRLFWDVPVASAVIGNSEVLKPQLERYGKIELFGELPASSNVTTDSKSSKTKTKPAP